jgi:arylsulfatase A-like enzyme
MIFDKLIRKATITLAAGAVFAMVSCQDTRRRSQEETAEERPNIIVIMTDDHATQAISSYGSKLVETPHIDELAREGVLFNQATVTNSICAPSRAVLLTGKHSHLNGVATNKARFDSSQMTFPKVLQDHGYQTAIIGKWHLKSQPTGFDHWNVLPGQGHYYNPAFIKEGKDTTYQGYVTEIITDLSKEWMEQRDSEKPFLLMMHHKAPHRNWMPALSLLDTFDTRKFPVPETFYDSYQGRPHLEHQKLTVANHLDYQYDLKIPCDTCPVAPINSWAPYYYNLAMNRLTGEQREQWFEGYQDDIEYFRNTQPDGRELDQWKYQRYMEDYLRCIVSVDRSIGRLMDFLESEGLDENTLVVYTSDQGFFLGEHGLFDKRYMYEESFRTPLIMKYPGKIRSGKRSDKLVQNLDVAPTLLDFAGAEVPDAMQGKSMQPLLTGKKGDQWRDAVYYHFSEKGWGVASHYGVRTDRYKLIHFYDPVDQWELYDLKEDPLELINLYDNPQYQDVVKRLKKKLSELQQKYNDPVKE